MTSFIANDFRSNDYSNFRPTYPPEWYTTLNRYHKASHGLAVDIGCGPGTATTALQNFIPFDRVIGIDPSEPMIQAARANQEKYPPTRPDNASYIEYYVCPAEQLTDFQRQMNITMIDMITAAECVHWLDWQRFQREAYSTLAPGGTLALWGYVDPVFVDFPHLDDVIDTFMYSEETLGPYWEQPGRDRLRMLFPHVEFDPNLFVDDVIIRHHPRDPFYSSDNILPLRMEKTMTLEAFSRYIETWSSYYAWHKQNAASIMGNEQTLLKTFMNNVMDATGLSRDSHVRVAWKTITCLARRAE